MSEPVKPKCSSISAARTGPCLMCGVKQFVSRVAQFFMSNSWDIRTHHTSKPTYPLYIEYCGKFVSLFLFSRTKISICFFLFFQRARGWWISASDCWCGSTTDCTCWDRSGLTTTITVNDGGAARGRDRSGCGGEPIVEYCINEDIQHVTQCITTLSSTVSNIFFSFHKYLVLVFFISFFFLVSGLIGFRGTATNWDRQPILHGRVPLLLVRRQPIPPTRALLLLLLLQQLSQHRARWRW